MCLPPTSPAGSPLPGNTGATPRCSAARTFQPCWACGPPSRFQLYCPDPYWHSVAKELTVSRPSSVTPTFRLPVCYDVHSYGVREQANYLRIAQHRAGHPGAGSSDAGTPAARWSTPASRIRRPASFCALPPPCRTATSCRLYRENGQLKLEQIIDGTGYNIMSTLDGSSTLWTLRHGTQAWQRTADSGDGMAVPDPDHACTAFYHRWSLEVGGNG